ncbi:hypothetical protein LINPERHAP1_LOCUS12060 [Linum perenne]
MGKSWEISIRAKGGSRFRFRFKAKLAETRTKFHRFPFLSKLHKLLINPKTTTSTPKFVERSKRLPPSRSKHDAIASKKALIQKNPEAKLSLIRQGKTSTDKRSTRGVLLHGSSAALFAFLLLIECFSSSSTSKVRSLVAIVVAVVAVVAAIGVGSDGHGSVWRAWRYAASSGSVEELSRGLGALGALMLQMKEDGADSVHISVLWHRIIMNQDPIFIESHESNEKILFSSSPWKEVDR